MRLKNKLNELNDEKKNILKEFIKLDVKYNKAIKLLSKVDNIVDGYSSA